LLSLKSISDRTAAEKLIGNLVSIPSNLLKSKKGEMIFLSEILNFKVFDGKNEVGEIISFSSNGPQDLLVVKGEKHQSEIPFVEAFIKKIDYENRLIKMDLPEGLINLDDEDEEK
jgi:16S rRNA processing protein RimM